ncbi:MAG: YbjN domain-containing protein [Myxococcales bacterium]|nr:YbjN domain-containing protein [Myxococcales bacterium]MCB9751879.1 YbjN domain-containing protein [Myxococcales bacterium]
MELVHEPLDDGTWLVSTGNLRHTQIVVKIQEPIVLFTTPVFELREDTPDCEALFRTLLELNEELLHCAYGLQDRQLLLSGAHPVETLDFNEFQAMIDDMSMSLDSHLEQLARWRPSPTAEEAT